MPHFSAHLSMLFTELPFLDRFAAAADQGFDTVEFLFPYDHEPEEIAKRLKENGLKLAIFNAWPGDWDQGERGHACIPGREKQFDASIEQAIPYAKALNCPRIHVMAGNYFQVGYDKAAETYKANIARAAQRLAAEGLELCIEPINRYSMSQYFLSSLVLADLYIREMDQPNVRLLFDIFHCQMGEGNVSNNLRRYFERIAHVQVAGAPDRHEPDSGELCCARVFDLLDELGYKGVVGCEYNPAGETAEGLGWIRQYGVRPRA